MAVVGCWSAGVGQHVEGLHGVRVQRAGGGIALKPPNDGGAEGQAAHRHPGACGVAGGVGMAELKAVLQGLARHGLGQHSVEAHGAEEGALVGQGQATAAHGGVYARGKGIGPQRIKGGQGLGARGLVFDAQVHAKARAGILAVGGAAARGGLAQQRGARRRFHAEVKVRPARPLQVDRGRKDGAGKVAGQVIDAKVAARLGQPFSQRIVLQPVHIEGAHLEAANRVLRLAMPYLPTHHPSPKQAAHGTPGAVWQGVVPDGDAVLLHRPPLGLHGGQRELHGGR